jgi:hypothetical protein
MTTSEKSGGGPAGRAASSPKPTVKIRVGRRRRRPIGWLAVLATCLVVGFCEPFAVAAPPPLPEAADELVGALAAGALAGAQATSSELSFEYLALRHIPSAQLCQLDQRSRVNSV